MIYMDYCGFIAKDRVLSAIDWDANWENRTPAECRQHIRRLIENQTYYVIPYDLSDWRINDRYVFEELQDIADRLPDGKEKSDIQRIIDILWQAYKGGDSGCANLR